MNRRQFLATPALAAAPAAAPSRAGFAERDITPEIGMEQPGGYGKVFHRSLHDPCKVRAAVFGDGAQRAALVGVDALMVPRATVLAARRAIRERCGIPEIAVMVGASHSHSSGPTGMVQPGEYDHASAFVRSLAYEKSSAADAGYLRRVEAEIVNAVAHADAARADARATFGSGVEKTVAFNRRFRMKNGLTFTHPGKGNPDIVEPAGPVDPEVGVVGAWDAKGKLLGCVVNFCCHATTNPGGISANWIYYLEGAIRGTFGPHVVVVFLQGFSGDVTQVDNLNPAANPPAEKWAMLVGSQVGAAAVKALLAGMPGDALPVDARSRAWRIPRRAPSPERVRAAMRLVESGKPGTTDWIFAKETVLLGALLEKERDVEVEAQAVQVGPAVFVSAPGEMFCQLGLDIKAARVAPFTWPVELANGCAGYIPTEEALGTYGGGYETRLTSYSNLVPSAGRQLVQAGVELTRQFMPGRVPEAPKPPAFKEPWSYGNVPPELR